MPDGRRGRDAPGFCVIDAVALGCFFGALILGISEFHSIAVCALTCALAVGYLGWRGLFG
jgi:hypothetical protein